MSKLSELQAMIFYPPGPCYQRGEDRCQANVEASTATVVREPNDLCVVAAILKGKGLRVFCRDYQTESLSADVLLDDVRAVMPDIIFVSVTNATIFDDLALLAQIKAIVPTAVIIAKGAIFFNAADEVLSQLDLSECDYLVGGECEFAVGGILDAHYSGGRDSLLPQVSGILFRQGNSWQRTGFDTWCENLDSIPLPDRSVIKNELYVRPDTGAAQATIITSRGCPSRCIYCQTPVISGTRLRCRSPQNIIAEIKDCYERYGIKNFFFRSDTFTFDAGWVKELCSLIISEGLHKQIQWVANSRTRPLTQETLDIMKQAGCWLVAFGFESGHPDSLKRMKKGVTLEDNINACRMAKKAGLKIFGFYMIGLPWENMEHLHATAKLMFDNDTDFVELHMAIPFFGTELYALSQSEGLIKEELLGRDYFTSSATGTKFLTHEQVEEFRRSMLLKYHLRPGYIARKVISAIGQPHVLANYFRFGMRMLRKR